MWKTILRSIGVFTALIVGVGIGLVVGYLFGTIDGKVAHIRRERDLSYKRLIESTLRAGDYGHLKIETSGSAHIYIRGHLSREEYEVLRDDLVNRIGGRYADLWLQEVVTDDVDAVQDQKSE